MKCKYCNEELPEGIKFCPNCGAETGAYSGAMPGVGETPPPQKPVDFGSWDAPEDKPKPKTGWTPIGDGDLMPSGGYSSGETESPRFVNFGEAIKLYFKNYVNFHGRSTRSEYWYSFIFVYLISQAASIIDREIGFSILSAIVALGTLIPNISIAFRRLHDIGKSGFVYILCSVVSLLFVGGMLLSMLSQMSGHSYASNSDYASMLMSLLGTWLVLLLVPIGLGIYLIVLYAKPSQMVDNMYGRAPK